MINELPPNKWIIADGEVIWGRNWLHKDFVKHRPDAKVAGGGSWEILKEHNAIIFYGSSTDYGQVSVIEWVEADKWRIDRKEFSSVFFTIELTREAAIQRFFNPTND